MRNNSIIADRIDRSTDAHRANRDVSCTRTTRLALTRTCNVRHNSSHVIHYKRSRRFQPISASAASNAAVPQTAVLNNENSDSPKSHDPFTINCSINPSANYASFVKLPGVICQSRLRGKILNYLRFCYLFFAVSIWVF